MIKNSWDEILKREFEAEYFIKLSGFIAKERESKIIYPPECEVYAALELAPPENIKVIILGQDPYINPGEAHGLAFSVKSGVKLPPSLRNIFKEIEADTGKAVQGGGNLERWAEQGVLLLNTVLTVESGKSNSHAKQGWEIFTDYIIKYLGEREMPAVFMLWGKHAQAKEKLINGERHMILKAAHPSPLSANTGFFGCRHFSLANKFLMERDIGPVDWL